MRYIKKYNEGVFDLFKKKKKSEMEIHKDPKNINDLVSVFLQDNDYHLYEEDGKWINSKYVYPIRYNINDDYTVDLVDGIRITKTKIYEREIATNNEKGERVYKKSFGFCIKDYGKGELPIRFNRVDGNFNVDWGNFEDMRYFPKYVGGNLDASGTYINSLEGCPEYIGGDFRISGRGHLSNSPFLLRSLEHCATHIGGNLDVNGQGIYSFEYFPKKLIGNFICENNPIYPIWILLNMDKSNIELFNDFDPVRASEKENGKPILYLDVLESLLNELEITYSDYTRFTNKQIKSSLKFYENLSYSYDVMDSSGRKISTGEVRQFCNRVIPKDDDSFEL